MSAAVSNNGRSRPWPTVDLAGVLVDAVYMEEAVAFLGHEARAGRGGIVVTPNLDHLRLLAEGSELKQAYAIADLVVADGMPLLWAAKLAGSHLPQRVTGADLLWEVSKYAAQHELPIALVGGRPEAAERAASVLRGAIPSLVIATTLCPVRIDPLIPENDVRVDDLATELRSCSAQIVFLAFGCPKQELIATRLVSSLPGVWFLGVGAALDMASGHVPRAPKVMQQLGLEWTFRLIQEPGRLAGRYLIKDIPYAAMLFASAIKQRVMNMVYER